MQIIIDGMVVREVELKPQTYRYRTRLRLEPGRHVLELVCSRLKSPDQILLDRVEFH